MAESKYRFDFAISFAGAKRKIARKVRDALVEAGFSVFFDEDYEYEMLGQDGSLYLRKIYSQESRYCIVLISREYDQRAWANLERESIQSRELRGEQGVLIPVLIDSHQPAWLPETRIYFDISKRTLVELTKLLAQRPGVKSTHIASKMDVNPGMVKGVQNNNSKNPYQWLCIDEIENVSYLEYSYERLIDCYRRLAGAPGMRLGKGMTKDEAYHDMQRQRR